MKKCLLIVWLFSLQAIGQSAHLTGIPDEADIYSITLKSGQTIRDSDTITGALKTSGGFIKDLDFPADIDTLPSNLTIVVDSPSEPGEENLFKRSILAVVKQGTHQQEARYKREGFVLQMVGDNKPLYIHATDVARQARLDALEADWARQLEELRPAADTNLTVDVTPPTSTGLAAAWGRHVVTVLVASVLLIGIWKFSF